MKQTAVTALFDRLDQARVLGDLSTFFGPQADAYLQHYQKMRHGSGLDRMFTRSWSWPAFLLSYGWFFYRKLYLTGAIMVLLPIVFGMVSHGAAGLSWLCFAATGKTSYVHQALARIVEADKLGLQGEARVEFLQRAGGVSWPAGAIAAAAYLAVIGLVVLQIATRTHSAA